MGFIADAVKSAFTAPGTNAANTDRDRKSTVQKGARDAFSEINPLLQSQAKFATSIGPLWERSAMDNINATNPWQVQNRVEGYRQGQLGTNIANLPMIRQILSQGGTSGIGAMQGAQLGAINNANESANEMAAYWASPAGRAALAQMRMQAIQGGMSIPSLGTVGNLANIIYGRPAPQVGPSPLAGIANIGGTLLGGGFFNFGGGGGGSGGFGSNAASGPGGQTQTVL